MLVFSNNQLTRLANIFDNAGQVSLAGFVIPFFTGNSAGNLAVAGFVFSLAFWLGALLIERKTLNV